MQKVQRFQRIDENTFKLMEVHKYSTEELQTMWDDDKDGEYIQLDDSGRAVYVAHGMAMEEIVPPTNKREIDRFVGGPPDRVSVTQRAPVEYGDESERQMLRMIEEWCKKHNFWPNIWFVNQRGNIELVDRKTGKYLGGLV